MNDLIIKTYEQETGKTLSEGQKSGLDFVLDGVCQNITSTVALQQVSYMLATVEHEVGCTWRPINECGQPSYFERYEQGRLGKVLGNDQRGDGLRFRGRGYCQITGKGNYNKFGALLNQPLVENPDLALDKGLALSIMTIGMRDGLFTGKKLGDYINASKTDYVNARRIINGDVEKNGKKIAQYAVLWEKILSKHLLF